VNDIKKAAALLRQRDNILILTHLRPDGDTTGCAAGLCAMLRQIGKTAYVLYNPEITDSDRGYVEPYWAPEDFAPDFVVSVDIADRQLFYPAAAAYFDRIGLAVDHHPSFEGFGAHQCVDPSRAACGEIVYEICRELGEVTAEVALPLYVAVSTDTGCFVYANTTANTHRVAAALLETGIDYFSVNKRHFRTKSRRRIALESALSETELQIEYLTGSLRRYDSLVGYSTVNLQLREVYRLSTDEETPMTFGERLGSAFSTGLQRGRDNMEELVIGLAANWMTLLLLAAVIAGGVLGLRRLGRRRRKAVPPPQPAGEEKKDE